MATTVNYSWELPDVGADKDTWGGILNAALSDVDAEVFANAALAAAALPKAGGTMTGQLTLPGGGTGLQAITVNEVAAQITAAVGGHIASTSNPHSVTAAQVGAYTIAGADAAFAKLAGAAFTGAVSFANNITLSGPVILGTETITFAGAMNLSFNGASRKYITITGNCTVTLTDIADNRTIEVWLLQSGATGDITWSGVTQWIGGTPVLSNVAGRRDLVAFTTLTGGIVIGQHIGVAQ